jgi:hypothetical protein
MSKEKYGFVYLWRDRKHKRYYIGCHWGTVDDGYICSSSWMKQAYKHRPEDFKRKILVTDIRDRSKLHEEEFKFLSRIKDDELKTKYYNLNNHHFNHWTSNPNTLKTTRERISQNTKAAMQRPEVREKYLEGLKTRDNKASDPKVSEKKRNSMIKTMAEKFPVEERYNPPKFNSQEYKDNMVQSISNRWSNMSDEERSSIGSKISEGLTGKSKTGKAAKGHVKTEEHRKKISESNRLARVLNPNLTCAGKFWWNNGIINKRSSIQPGIDWIKGKLPHKKK